jgi:SH3-like domain-containing protein
MKRALFLLICFAWVPSAAMADTKTKGDVTNLPIPRFVSLKSAEANARRGPSLSHRIDWVYKRKHMPLEIFGEYENWRRVRDAEGMGGWIHYSLLSGVRTVLVRTDLQAVHAKPDDTSHVVAKFERNVVADLEACTVDWCQIIADGYEGWVPKTALWGVYPDEIRK